MNAEIFNSKNNISPSPLKKIEFFRHNLSPDDKTELLKVLDSIFLTTGSLVKQFEKKFAEYLNSKYAVGVMSCTHALELALRYFNIGAGDEVITTPMSFVATSNVIEYVGAKTVFVDVEPISGNINADLIEEAITKNTKAILVVHLHGQMCDMKKISSIAKKYNLKIIEDCAHCIEGSRDGIRPGQLGDVACFSFYATKNLTCGEGGAITCNDYKIYEWLLKARQHGISKSASERYTKKYEHYDLEFLGFKCNMNDIQAALMINQIDKLDLFLSRKKIIADKYTTNFSKNLNIKTPKVYENSQHAWHLYTILVNPKKRDTYMHTLQDAGIGIAVNYRPIHLMKYYKEKYKYSSNSFPVAESIGESTITLPLYYRLNDDEINHIVDNVNMIIQD